MVKHPDNIEAELQSLKAECDRLDVFAILFMLMIQFGFLGWRMYALGADTACATAKECPPDFKAKWVEAGCVCVPTAAARR